MSCKKIWNECSEAWRKTLQMVCSTRKSIFPFTTCYPKIHLHTLCNMQLPEWELMGLGGPVTVASIVSSVVFWQWIPKRALPRVCLYPGCNANHCTTLGVRQALHFRKLLFHSSISVQFSQWEAVDWCELCKYSIHFTGIFSFTK